MCWVSGDNLNISLYEATWQTYRDRYSRYFPNIFLCRKKGDKVQTSVSFKVPFEASWKIGSMKENVLQDQSVTLSSGQERVTDGI